eukprot:7387913-Prymnesium_polylepis.2
MAGVRDSRSRAWGLGHVSKICGIPRDHQPVPENSLRGDRSKRSSCGERPNVESAGTVTCRRQHFPVRREVRPEEVRCLRPPPA